MGGESGGGHRADAAAEVRGAARAPPRPRARRRSADPRRAPELQLGGRARGRARQSRRPLARPCGARRRPAGDRGRGRAAAVATNEARQILTDFAATLAPSRAATLLALPGCAGSSSTRVALSPATWSAARSARPRGRRRRAAARPAGSAASRTAVAIASGSSSTSTFAPAATRVDPLGRGAHRDARDAVPVRLLLEAARVGRDHARLRCGRGECEVAERLAELDVRPERDRLASPARAAVRGCAGRTTGSSSCTGPSTILRRRSGRTFASRWTVATT